MCQRRYNLSPATNCAGATKCAVTGLLQSVHLMFPSLIYQHYLTWENTYSVYKQVHQDKTTFPLLYLFVAAMEVTCTVSTYNTLYGQYPNQMKFTTSPSFLRTLTLYIHYDIIKPS